MLFPPIVVDIGVSKRKTGSIPLSSRFIPFYSTFTIALSLCLSLIFTSSISTKTNIAAYQAEDSINHPVGQCWDNFEISGYVSAARFAPFLHKSWLTSQSVRQSSFAACLPDHWFSLDFGSHLIASSVEQWHATIKTACFTSECFLSSTVTQ